jgi:GTP-binding protein
VVRRGSTEIVVADIPGLIEGAGEGRGLGFQFLRHVERTRVLVVLLDLASAEGMLPEAQLEVLLHELATYRPDLATRPRIVVGSRADLAASAQGVPKSSWSGPLISAVTGLGVDALVGAMFEQVSRSKAAEPRPPRLVVHRPEARGVAVHRDPKGRWVVTGRQAERAVALSDLTLPDALSWAQDRLRSLGVDRALAKAGARAGDVVVVGGLELEYQPDAPRSLPR